MADIYNQNGDVVGSIDLSEKQSEQLAAGVQITVQYHTPRQLQGTLAPTSGSFTLQITDDRLVTENPAAVVAYTDIQLALRNA